MKPKIQIKEKINKTNIEYVNDFITHCKVRGLSQETLNSYESNCNLFIQFLNDKSISDTTNDDINKYILSMREKGNTNNTIISKGKFIKTLLKYCEVDVKFPTISREKIRKEPYTEEEIKILLKKPTRKSYTQYRNWTIVNFLLATGIRCRTLVNIKIKDIDFTNNTIYLRVTKTHKAFYIPMSSSLRQVLKDYLLLFDYNEDDYLFMNQYGDQLSRSTVKSTIRDYNLRRGIRKTSIHLYRHTYAINFLRSGGNIMYLKTLLGHEDLKTTQQYLYITTEDLKVDYDDFCPLDNAKRKGIKLVNKREKVGK